MTTAAPAAIAPVTKGKIAYIDNLKIILTTLVILHHTFITYGAPGGWYYTQKTTQMGALVPMTLFVAVNQAFFMGFFFFLSALFIPSSYDKKGPKKFLADRLLRLGIPLVFYSLILSPVLNYMVYRFGRGHHITFMQFLSGYDDWIDFGVLWFVAALLLFTLLYACWRAVASGQNHRAIALPRNGIIAVFALGVGLLTFVVRQFFPVGWVLHPVGFQLGHWAQYITLFILGIIAPRNKWLDSISIKQSKQMFIVALLLIFIVFPLFFVYVMANKIPLDNVNGGMHLVAFLYALWEQLTGFCIIVALLGWARARLNRPSAFSNVLSRSTFAVYIMHPAVVIGTALSLSGLNVDPAFKLLIAIPIVVTLSFLMGSLIVRIPGVNKIV